MDGYSKQNLHPLAVFSDAAHMDLYDGRSTVGYSIFYKGTPISFSSKAASLVTLSTKESEEFALVKAVCKAMQINGILVELGLADPAKPFLTFVDSTSCLDSIIGDKIPTGSRHAASKTSWLREMRALGVFSPHFVPSHYQVADLHTKAFGKQRFRELRDLNCGYSPEQLIHVIVEGSAAPYRE